MSHNIVLKDIQGNDVVYEGVSSINLLDTSGNTVIFGEPIVSGDLTDLDYIKYHDAMTQLEQGKPMPTDEEYEEIISKGYKMLDYVFRGVK